jgi:hypothetical protein
MQIIDNTLTVGVIAAQYIVAENLGPEIYNEVVADSKK